LGNLTDVKQSNEDTWTDKVKYKIYIPSRYYVFGTSIPVEFTLLPLRKGVKIGKIKMEVLERVGLETSPQQNDETYSTTLPDKVVASVDQKRLPDNMTTLIEPSTGMQDDSYNFKVVLPLKKSLNSCRQSANSKHIKVHHNLKIYVNIHNPDGHVSQLCLRNLIHLYISPHMHINDDQSVSTNITVGDDVRSLETSGDPFMDAPPLYGSHILDQLYDNIDHSAFVSGFATPMHLGSANDSTDDLTHYFGHPSSQLGFHIGVQGSEESSRSSSPFTVDPAAQQLQARLAALEGRRPSISSVIDIPIDSPPTHNSPRLAPIDGTASPPATSEFPLYSLSRRTSQALLPLATNNRSRNHSSRNSISQPSGLPTPPLSTGTGLRATQNRNMPPAPFDLSALQRTPSYATAIRTPPVGVSFEGILPSYEELERTEQDSTMLQSSDAITEAAPGSSELVSASDLERRPRSQFLLPPAHRGGGADFRPRPGSSLTAPQRAHVRGRSLGRVELSSAIAADVAAGGFVPLRTTLNQSRLRSEIIASPIEPQPIADSSGLPRLVSPVGAGSLSGFWGRRGSH
jgi:Arrestin (or S-antigen), C-terminal domain